MSDLGMDERAAAAGPTPKCVAMRSGSDDEVEVAGANDEVEVRGASAAINKGAPARRVEAVVLPLAEVGIPLAVVEGFRAFTAAAAASASTRTSTFAVAAIGALGCTDGAKSCDAEAEVDDCAASAAADPGVSELGAESAPAPAAVAVAAKAAAA